MKVRMLVLNLASMASLRLGSALLVFALFWFLSHHLSPSELGGYSLLMNFFFLFQSILLLGLNMPLMRRIAARPQDAALETSNSFFFALPVAAVIGTAIALTGHFFAGDGLAWPFVLLGLSILPTAWTVVAECVLVGQEQMYGIACVNLFEALARVVGAVAVIIGGWGLTGVFLVFVGLRFTAAAAYLFSRYLPAPSWRLVAAGIQRSYIRDVPTYLAIAVVTGLCVRLDILMVSKLLSLHDAGIYAAASRLSDAALMLPTTAAIVIFPTQARLFETNRAGFANFMGTAIRWYLIVGFAAALLVFALSPFIVQLLYAPALAGAAPILEILILGAAMMVLDQLLSTTMMAARAQHADLRSMIFGLATLVVLIFLFAHFFGLLGAALASPAALLVRVLYRLRWAQHLFAKPLVWPALRVLAAAAVAVAVLYFGAATGRAVDLIGAYAAYGIVLWATRSLQRTDWQALRAFLAAQRQGPRRA